MTKPTPAAPAADPGVWAALAAALLFGAGAPFAKRLLIDASPWMLAALLYLGSGHGLALYRTLGRQHTHRHRHAPRRHRHPHYPDAHHGHTH